MKRTAFILFWGALVCALATLGQTPQPPVVHINPQHASASQDPLAAFVKPKASDEETITVITSDRLFYDYKQKFALFETNVVVVDPRIKITADQMTVFFDASNKVSAIDCAGNVKISQEDKTAKSAKATYDVHTGDIVLTGGRPEVVSASGTMTGDPIIFNRDNNTVSVPGTLQKPRIVIMPGKSGAQTDLLNIGTDKPKANKQGKAGAEK
jgi:lipopolysaccharide transport protein LptA